MSGLKVLKAIVEEKSIKRLLHTSLSGWEEPRDHNVIHASDLLKNGGICPREWALYDVGAVFRKKQFISTSMRVTFEYGRYAETILRNKWLRKHIVGNWRCNVCNEPHAYGKAPKGHCTKCGFKRWIYQEYRVFSEDTGISGSLDSLVDTKAEKLRVLEVKTIDKDAFKDLKAPLAEHRFRSSLYLRLAEESDCFLSDRVDLHTATILYMSKSFGFKDSEVKSFGVGDHAFSPFKEFTVSRDDALTDPYVFRARALHHWRQIPAQDKALPCGICKNGFIKRAQNCPANKVCFSGNYPSGYTWVEGGAPLHPDKEVL